MVDRDMEKNEAGKEWGMAEGLGGTVLNVSKTMISPGIPYKS